MFHSDETIDLGKQKWMMTIETIYIYMCVCVCVCVYVLYFLLLHICQI